eukprot:m.140193 g.140193  ORF g.140193 m.140193 type:complete len:84 (-) comp14821_c0_seq2:1376-1627(-)
MYMLKTMEEVVSATLSHGTTVCLLELATRRLYGSTFHAKKLMILERKLVVVSLKRATGTSVVAAQDKQARLKSLSSKEFIKNT